LNKVVKIFLLIVYTFGTFCFPLGDYSIIGDLPAMYQHCKATEDKDLTPFDFVTDHLLNLDGLFDKHDNGDQQKPHKAIPNYHNSQTTFYFITNISYSTTPFYLVDVKPLMRSLNFIPSNYVTLIFRPPKYV